MKRTPLYWMSVLSVLLGASSYGFLSPFIKEAYDAGFTFEQVTLYQTGIGTLLLWIIALVRIKWWRNPFRGPWIKLAVIGIVGLMLTTILYNRALERLDASLAIVLLFQFTWITILLDSIRRRTWPGKFRIIAIIVVMAGTLLAVGLLEAKVANMDAAGVAFGLLAAVTYSLFLWLTGLVQEEMDPVIKSAVMMSAGFLLVALLYGSKAVHDGADGSLLGWGLLLGVLGQVIPTILFNIGIPTVGSSLAALLGSMELPVAAIAAWLILGEYLSGWKVAGIALILAGIVIAELPSGEREGRSKRLEENR
ncbi:DMT family transporter [Paenibacillus oenotherae]|uniref:DMT family transporter n=1 Tax=Paenibacillus oenotherae TaxID=1435645 RepID=A0ABS7D9U2_9BACL|nr:DMT family transporter [Paenibacillus oenotherae]MBW7476277.1 DMT family transporter [Paenibacillus oenotherae]